MKNHLKNYLLLYILFLLGIVFLAGSILLYSIEDTPKWVPELAKSMMGFSFTAIIGGLMKLLFDEYQKIRQYDEKTREFKLNLLNQLRKVFDNVDSARLVMEAHKSAKTYSEKMQLNIIPSIVTLFDIKRSLVDSKEMLDKEKLLQLRINIHYMIAYLQALANEYRDMCPAISNQQFLHEKLKEKAAEKFIVNIIHQYPNDFYSDKALSSQEILDKIIQPPQWIWDSILGLKNMGLFIKYEFTSPYRKMFVEFYENCKKILKEQDYSKMPAWYRKEYCETMIEIDERARKGVLNQGDNLVNELVKYLESKP